MRFTRFSARLARHALLAGVTAAALVACGGGTSQFEAFVPDRYAAFGDETSVLTSDGRKYGVNALTSTDAIDCASEPIWVQAVASNYGFRFAQCNPEAATPKAFLRATTGAKVADLAAQIDAQAANGGTTGKVLATVLVGSNDILEAYAKFPSVPEDQLVADLRGRGERLAAQVNRLTDLGVKVIVSTVPDMGLTPFAIAQKAAFTDTDRAALLTRLTAALNGRLRVNILNDGRFVGLVLADEMVQVMNKSPVSFGLTDAVTAICTTALPDCTSKTLVASTSSAAYLWADGTRMAYGGQNRLGILALSRALGNPF